MLRKRVLQLAAVNQLQLHPQTLKALLDELLHIDSEVAREELLRRLFRAFVDREGSAREISLEFFLQCLDTAKGDGLRMVNAFTVVPLDKIPMMEKTRIVSDKLISLKQRFAEAHSRCARSGRFRNDDGNSHLLSISSLDGQDATIEVSVVGVLRHRQEEWLIEDPSNELQLDVIGCDRTWMIEGLIVVVSGFAKNGKFQALRVALPPCEKREDSLSFYRGLDFFGLAPHDVHVARQLEERATRSAVCVLSEVLLDSDSCLKQLVKFFSAFEDRTDPELDDLCFVLVGNFSSRAVMLNESCHVEEISSREKFRRLFDAFASSVDSAAHRVCQHALFVFVPGPNDPTPLVGVLPAPPFSSNLLSLNNRFRHLTFAPNPCRLRFFTTEIVICRRDFQRELGMVRGPVLNEHEKPYESVTKLVCSSAHLAPLSQSILWKLDHTLQLPVLPHLLVLCDRSDQWSCSYKEDCQVVNPGCFASSGTFLWFTPADKDASINRVA